ncbi:MAG: energy-coupling factor transporter transmembrane protein EcfT [Ruminiclostridium sp.]|nr:energy-coupling factor transporter transmembrane protein EcfT [Ruminiclostridium sp.]
MRGFAELNPAVTALYYAFTVGIAMFCMHPVIITLSLVGALLHFVTADKRGSVKLHLSFFLLFLVLAVINPIWYHNGVTVLFVVNDSPITLEAVLYGVFAAGMMISVLYRFRTFSLIMTADKLMYFFGRLSPKLSLILCMALRYVPLMRAQNSKIRSAQKALGIYREDNIADTLKGEARIFSIMATWSLENGIITADSMESRGYGTHRRTSFSLFRFRLPDGLFLALCAGLTAVTVTAAALGETDFSFYPAMSGISVTPLALAAYISYGILSVLPALVEWKEAVKWKYLISRI